MTFYEAALRVLEEAGSPLLALEITKRAIDKNLLSHVGKTPEVTMLSRLAAMARRPRDRKILVTARDTFALTDWMLAEDAEALAITGVPEVNPEEALPPYRPVERHPEPHAEFIRAIGRQGDRKRRGDERKKYPPVAEVAFELLSEAATALVPAELIARLKAREMADDLNIPQLLEGLADDNQKRADAGRKPAFSGVRLETGELQLSIDTAPLAEGGPSPIELREQFCTAAQLKFENGRVVLRAERHRDRDRDRDRDRGERDGSRVDAAPLGVALGADDLTLIQTAKHAGRDARRAMARVFRKVLGELELGTFEKACVRMLHKLHFRELKVARRSKDGPTFTARRKDGSLELRSAIRFIRGTQSVDRKHVQDLRRDLGNYGANIGLVLSAGESRGDARAEATNGALVLLWCGDGLSDKFFEAGVGVSVTTIELYELDEAFFAQARLDADEAAKRREERHREKEQRGGSGEVDPSSAPTPPPLPVTEAAAAPAEVLAAPVDGDEGDDGEEGDDEGPDEVGAEGGAPTDPTAEGSEGRKRRRRRRRRRRGGNREGQPGAPGAVTAEGGSPAAPGGEAPAPGEAPVSVVDAAPRSEAPTPPPPTPAPSSESSS